MAYPVYNSAQALAASSNAAIPNNKGLLIVNTGSGAGTAVVYPTTADGSRGTAITLEIPDAHQPIIFPVRIHSTGAYSNVGVYELT